MKKKSAILILGIILIFNFTSCTYLKRKEDDATFSIGLVIDSNPVDKNYFNQLAMAGVKEVNQKLGIKISIIKSKSDKDYKENIEESEKKNRLTIVAGSELLADMEYVAQGRPDKAFCIIDGFSELPNVKSITFRDEEGAFLMGIIAAMYSKTGKVGYIGGVENEVAEFTAGYISGVRHISKEMASLIIDGDNKAFINSYFDDNKAYEAAKKMYENGVDVIFHATGAGGIGVFRAAKETNNYAIGVDVDEAEAEANNEFEKQIISSMLKRIDKAIFDAGKEVEEGDFTFGPKNELSLGLKEDGIDIAPSTENHVSKTILDTVNYYKTLIIEKKIFVPTNLDELRGNK